MSVRLEVIPNEKSTLKITFSYTDENNNDVTPNLVRWSLYDNDGNVVNNRLNQSIAIPSTSDSIVLYGNDLDISTYGISRNLLVYIEYDSSLGNDLPAYEEIGFEIRNLYNVI